MKRSMRAREESFRQSRQKIRKRTEYDNKERPEKDKKSKLIGGEYGKQGKEEEMFSSLNVLMLLVAKFGYLFKHSAALGSYYGI